jgi:hypothetical protein
MRTSNRWVIAIANAAWCVRPFEQQQMSTAAE